MESIRVRPYSSADYPSICELDAPLFAGMGGPVLFRHIEELFPSLFFVADNSEDEIIGYILGGIHLDDPNTGKLIRIGVVPNYTKLTEALFSAMKQRNVTAIHLTVAETNKPAIAFYQKIGFIQKERIQNYFYPNIPRLVLWKTL